MQMKEARVRRDANRVVAKEGLFMAHRPTPNGSQGGCQVAFSGRGHAVDEQGASAMRQICVARERTHRTDHLTY